MLYVNAYTRMLSVEVYKLHMSIFTFSHFHLPFFHHSILFYPHSLTSLASNPFLHSPHYSFVQSSHFSFIRPAIISYISIIPSLIPFAPHFFSFTSVWSLFPSFITFYQFLHFPLPPSHSPFVLPFFETISHHFPIHSLPFSLHIISSFITFYFILHFPLPQRPSILKSPSRTFPSFPLFPFPSQTPSPIPSPLLPHSPVP